MKQVQVMITLKPGVLDPQGRATKNTLHHLGFDGVANVRQGKMIELEVDDATDKLQIEKMCEQLLANTVIESYSIIMPDVKAA